MNESLFMEPVEGIPIVPLPSPILLMQRQRQQCEYGLIDGLLYPAQRPGSLYTSFNQGGMETSDFSNLGNKRGCKPACCFSSWIAAQNLESQRLSLPIARPVSAPPTSRAAESHSSGIGNRSLAISAIRVHPDPD